VLYELLSVECDLYKCMDTYECGYEKMDRY